MFLCQSHLKKFCCKLQDWTTDIRKIFNFLKYSWQLHKGNLAQKHIQKKY